jgi:hypothetical protein
MKGDTVIIFGNNDKSRRRVQIRMCSGSKVISNNISTQRIKLVNKYLAEFELEAIRFYKSQLNYYDKIRPSIVIESKSTKQFPSRFILGKELIFITRNHARVCHLSIYFNHLGEVSKMKFLNRTPKSVKKQLKDFILNSKWLWNSEMKNYESAIVESFIYPADAIVFSDF